jgi:hypothetical protein
MFNIPFFIVGSAAGAAPLSISIEFSTSYYYLATPDGTAFSTEYYYNPNIE